jgi:hypothetical protein
MFTIKYVKTRENETTYVVSFAFSSAITDGLTTSTYQKNLATYIPPLSAHPHSCVKGLITGELSRNWGQNNPDTFQEIHVRFIEQLSSHGHIQLVLIGV